VQRAIGEAREAKQPTRASSPAKLIADFGHLSTVGAHEICTSFAYVVIGKCGIGFFE